jgi:hypothetical protein
METPQNADGSADPAHTFVMACARRAADPLRTAANTARQQKGRALRKPCLVCPDLVAPGYPGDIPTPSRATTNLFEPTLCALPGRPLEKTGAGGWVGC